jgi:hypothetical protein
MSKLDVDALLKKNPKVDRAQLEEIEKAIAEAWGLIGKKTEQPVAPPYGGRRIISDERGKQRTRIRVATQRVPEPEGD